MTAVAALAGNDSRARVVARTALWTLVAPLVVRSSPRRLVQYGPVGRPRRTTEHVRAARAVVRRLRAPVAARHPDGDCLVRAVVLFRSLGGPVDLVFGAALVDGELRGHAWLERDGSPWLEVVDPRTWCTETFRVRGSA